MIGNEPMSDERLAWIGEWVGKVTPQQAYYGTMQRFMRELVDKVKRSRAVEAKLRATIADEHSRLSQELDNATEPIGANEAYAGTGSNEELWPILASHGAVTDPSDMRDSYLATVLINWRNAACKDLADRYNKLRERAEEQASAHDRWLCYASNLESDLGTERSRADAAERKLAESLDALAVAAELIDRLTNDSACDYDHHDNCRTHSLQRRPCPHPLGRQFVEAWRAVEAEQKEAADNA